MLVVLPGGPSPLRVKLRGLNIGKSRRVRKLLVVALPIATPRTISLERTYKRCSVVMNSISHLSARAATNARTTSGSTPNW